MRERTARRIIIFMRSARRPFATQVDRPRRSRARGAESARAATTTGSARAAGNLAMQRQVRRAAEAAPSVRSLPHAARRFMEARFGADFGSVRLHTGAAAAQLTHALRARAVTHGADIYLAAGRNTFESAAERKLLAHELTHVVQQSGRLAMTGSRTADGEPAVDADQISRRPLSLHRYSWNEFTKDVGDVASSARQSVQSVVPSVAGGAAAAAAQTLDWSTLWRHIQVDWNSAPGLTLRAWGRQLDDATVRKIQAVGPAGVFDAVSIPDYVREAAAELGRNARMDVNAPPMVQPRVNPGLRPLPGGGGGIALGPLIVAVLVFLLIMLWPNTTPETAETQKLDEDRKRELENRKKENEKERGRCRETIPALRSAIHSTVVRELDRNAQDYLFARLGDTPRTKEGLGEFYLRNDFFFFLAIVKQTKNAILKVCSVANNTLATSTGNKHIGDPLHAEEIAAPALSAQLGMVAAPERAGASLYNVCQSRACAENARNPDGCTAVLQGIRDTQLAPGGEVVDEPTGFPPDLKPHSDRALERALRTRLPGP